VFRLNWFRLAILVIEVFNLVTEYQPATAQKDAPAGSPQLGSWCSGQSAMGDWWRVREALQGKGNYGRIEFRHRPSG
jgi:hypothetical protein